jgi:tetratricopeptide (TPR) repeat protein
MLTLGFTLLLSDDAATGLDVVDRAVRLLETEPPGPELVRAYGDMAATHANITSDLSEALRWAEKAMALSRELGLGEDSRGLGVRGSARCDRGDVGGLDDLRRAIELGLKRGLGRETAAHRNTLGISLSLIDGPIEARRELELGLDFAERRGIDEFVSALEGSIIEQLYELGDWDELLGRVDRMNERFEAQGSTWDLLVTRPVQARIFTSRGRLEEARPLVAWMLPASRDQGVTPFRVSSLAVGTDFFLAAGDAAAGVELAHELEAIPNFREAWTLPTYLPALVRTVIALGDPDFAGRLIEGVRPVTQFHQHSLAMVEAQLTEARGDLERAATLYEDASDRWERFGVVPELGHGLLGQGRCLATTGSSAADAILHEARGVFSGLGARPCVAEVDALLQQAALRSS